MAMAVLQGCGDSKEAEAKGAAATLLVDDTADATFNVAISGVLGVNERDCYTVGGDILVARQGLLEPDDKTGGLRTEDGSVIHLGESVAGNGAVLEVTEVLLANNPSWRACLPPDGRSEVFGLTAW